MLVSLPAIRGHRHAAEREISLGVDDPQAWNADKEKGAHLEIKCMDESYLRYR
jgi:hypothetical protein